MHPPRTSARAESRRRPTLTRTAALVAAGLFILTGVVVLPAFALENEAGDATTSTTKAVDRPESAGEEPAGTTTTTVPPEQAVEDALAAMTDEERRTWALYTMNPEQREAFGRYLSPPPEPEPAPAPRAAASVSPSGVWDQLAACEAGGNWAHAPVGSYGYSGGLMFLPSTWRAYGGGEFASQAYLAGRDAQIVVAQRILAGHGGSYRAWPGCRAKLGLP